MEWSNGRERPKGESRRLRDSQACSLALSLIYTFVHQK